MEKDFSILKDNFLNGNGNIQNCLKEIDKL